MNLRRGKSGNAGILLGCIALAGMIAGCLTSVGPNPIGSGESWHCVRGVVYYVTRGGLEGYEMQIKEVAQSSGSIPPPDTGTRQWITFQTAEIPSHASLIQAIIKRGDISPWYEDTHNYYTMYTWIVTDWDYVEVQLLEA